ncbi:MAG: group II intron reverse transcriptase/maturase [Elusimicrobia bacterium]|nr:group II intron reverse transcriptase/maturase [Elusimicrobiota bacterium]
MRFSSLGHLLDKPMLYDAWNRICKTGSGGVDGVTTREYAENLDTNLGKLHESLLRGNYRAPPVRRAWIPKANGTMRPIGIPTVEDKVVQRAVVSIMEAVYEPLFLENSYGFRPGKNAHQALESIQRTLTEGAVPWIVELDIESFFDNLSHDWLSKMVNHRLGDGCIRRLIGKWLNAGVLEETQRLKQEKGSPQGGVISPMLANIYLHYVLDVWFKYKVKPVLSGKACFWRYADDVLLAFANKEDAERVLGLLWERMGKFNLRLNETKTRLRHCRKPESSNDKPSTFDFLGFTHYWGLSRRGKAVIKRKTAADRLRRAMTAVAQWCRRNRHEPIKGQWERLNAALRGHYNYYGITGNFRSLTAYYQHVQATWQRWLSRRSQKAYVRWARMQIILKHYALETPRIVHSIYRKPRLRQTLLLRA